jgi:hypothetical protein
MRSVVMKIDKEMHHGEIEVRIQRIYAVVFFQIF